MTALPQNDVRPSLVGDALRRRWPIVLLTAALFTGAAGLFAFQIGSTYTSTAQVLLRPTPGNAFSPDSAKNAQQITVAMETEAGLVNSPTVAGLVSQEMKQAIESASPDVDAVISTNTQIVQVSYTAETPESAHDLADAYAQSFLQYRLQQTQQTLDRELLQLKKQEKSTQDNLNAATADASVDRPTAQAVAKVQLYSSRLASTQDLIGQAEATDSNPGGIIIPASQPTKPNGISPMLLLLAAGILGLAFGLVLAIWRERTDDRIRATVDPSSAGLPILGYVPAGGDDADEDRTEAFRQIRAGVVVATQEPLVLAVAPVADEVRVSASCYAAAELARSLSDSGRRVVVVDATAPQSGGRRVLGTHNGPGLMELLEGDAPTGPDGASAPSASSHLADEVSRVIQTVGGLQVVPAGTTKREPADLIAGDRMRLVIEELRARFDVVLLAAPSATSSQGNEVCMAADATVLVVTERRTRATTVAEAVERAARLGIRYIGLVALPRRGAAALSHVASDAPSEDEAEPAGGDLPQAGTEATKTQAATDVARHSSVANNDSDRASHRASDRASDDSSVDASPSAPEALAGARSRGQGDA